MAGEKLDETIKKISDNSFSLGKSAGIKEVVKELESHYIYGVRVSELLDADEKWQIRLRGWGIK